MTNQPLNVRVAEALGWRFGPNGAYPPGVACEMPCREHEHYESPPEYDTDWSACGMVVEIVSKASGVRIGFTDRNEFYVQEEAEEDLVTEYGATLTEAFSRYFLALRAAGKLPA